MVSCEAGGGISKDKTAIEEGALPQQRRDPFLY